MTMDRIALRNNFGRFATGVCVVTVMDNGKPYGMTVNSFSSLSLDPPLLLWSIQKQSECFSMFHNAEKFAVNILAESDMDLSNHFARKQNHLMAEQDCVVGEEGLPLLPDALASFECHMWNRYEGGDHVILVGEVKAMREADGAPLIFYSGGYHSLATPEDTF